MVEIRDDEIKQLCKHKTRLTEELIIIQKEKEMLTKQNDNYKNKVNNIFKEKPKTLTIGIIDTIAHLVTTYFGMLSKAHVGREIADVC